MFRIALAAIVLSVMLSCDNQNRPEDTPINGDGPVDEGYMALRYIRDIKTGERLVLRDFYARTMVPEEEYMKEVSVHVDHVHSYVDRVLAKNVKKDEFVRDSDFEVATAPDKSE